MIEVTKVTDDETGIWCMGEVEWKIHLESLESFLQSRSVAGATELKKALEYLKYEVDRYLAQVEGRPMPPHPYQEDVTERGREAQHNVT